MLRLKGDAKKLIILLHEIYGLNDHIRQYAYHFFCSGYDVLCPDFICTEKAFDYVEEKAAYQHFIEQVGFDKAYEEVSSFIKQERFWYEEIHIIGFSIGATVAWLCSSMEEVTSVSGYYGSRIREALHVNPICPVLLIYGKQGKSFDVKQLAENLTAKDVFIYTLEGGHGFADPYSVAYHEPSCKTALSYIQIFTSSPTTFRQ